MRRVLSGAAIMGAAPIAALVLLATSGAVAAGPAALAALGIMVAAGGLAFMWNRDLVRFRVALLHAVRLPDPACPQPAAPRMTGLAHLAEVAERVLRAQTGQAARAADQTRAEEEIIERLPGPLLMLDADLRVQRANAAARTEFGSETATVLRHPALRAATDRALAEGAPQSADLVLPAPVSRELQVTVTPLGPGPAGERLLISLADRTRERAVERMRADFVANAGHELRTPLAILIGFIDTLRGPAADDPQAQQRFLAIMSAQAARMQRLIDDLLSLSRIELLEHQRPTGQVDLADVARRTAAGFEVQLVAHKASLTTELDPALPPVTGDADQIEQVLQNLLDNALKYGGDGVQLRLAAERAHPGQRWPAQPGLVLSVTDTGPGIAREHLPRLTERFYRIDAGRSRAAGGTGLGLAIVKHIVNRHRGQLRVDSTEKVGTTVWIWLPFA